MAYGPVGVEIAERVVGERGQVDDRVEASEIRGRDVADVERRATARSVRRSPEVAARVEERVEADDVVPGIAKHGASTEPM